MSRRNQQSWLTIAAVALILVVAGFDEGDLAEDLTHLGSLVIGLLNRFGAAACLALLYIEESGVPLPAPVPEHLDLPRRPRTYHRGARRTVVRASRRRELFSGCVSMNP